MKKVMLSVIMCILSVGINYSCPDFHFKKKSVPVSEFDGSYVAEWLHAVGDVVKLKRMSPPVASRAYAYTSIAYYEGVVNGMPGFVSTEGKLNGLSGIPAPEKKKIYDWPTVAMTSAKNVTDYILSRELATYDKQLVILYEKQLTKRKAEVSQEIIDGSIAFGKQIADVIIEWAMKDNYEETRWLFYNPAPRSDNPSFWAPTDFGQIALEPYWGTIRTFACTASNQCDQELCYEFSIDASSTAYQEALEVYEVSTNLTEEQRLITLYWADDPGETTTPPGHWISIINQIVKRNHFNLEQSSYIMMEGCVAMADAFISCWQTKYRVNYLRPKTYIQEYLGHKNWEPFVKTPPFPEFSSGHSTCSGAIATVLTELIGDEVEFIDSTHVNTLGLDPRSFKSFLEAGHEATMSRLYGGIHFRCGNEQGFEEGECVGNTVLTTLNVKKN